MDFCNGCFSPCKQSQWQVIVIDMAESRKILLIDDDPFILDLMSKQLQAKGFKVISTTDPEKALPLAQAEQPSLVISDIAMPGIDGLTLLKGLRGNAQTEKIPLVLLTGSDKMSDVEEGFASGAQAYLLKPVDWDSAWGKISSLL